MAFLYLDAFDRHPGATAVSNNHFDQDGLVGVFALAAPDEALARRALPADYDATTALLYTEMLGRLTELCDHPNRSRDLWAEEDATLQASEDAITSGLVKVEEAPNLDLAIVTVPEQAPRAGGHRFGGGWVRGLHPMAVRNATERGALLTMDGTESSLAPERFVSLVEAHLRVAPAAWDPYRVTC